MALNMSSYIPTSGATAIRNADVLPFPFSARPQAMTIYLRFVEMGTIDSGSFTVVCNIGGNVSPRIGIERDSSRRYTLFFNLASGNTSSKLGTGGAPSIGDTVELHATLTANGVVGLKQSVNGGAIEIGSVSPGLTLPAAWATQKLWLNSKISDTVGFNAFRNVVIHRGVQSLTTMRRLAGVI